MTTKTAVLSAAAIGCYTLHMFRVLLLLISLMLFVYPVCASDEEILAKRLFSEVFSPFCPGRTLADCPSSSASELKNEIRKRIAEGSGEEEIKQYLYSLYGDEISALPGYRGFGAVAWIAPFAFLVLGAASAVVWLATRRVPLAEEKPRVLSSGEEVLLRRELDP